MSTNPNWQYGASIRQRADVGQMMDLRAYQTIQTFVRPDEAVQFIGQRQGWEFVFAYMSMSDKGNPFAVYVVGERRDDEEEC